MGIMLVGYSGSGVGLVLFSFPSLIEPPFTILPLLNPPDVAQIEGWTEPGGDLDLTRSLCRRGFVGHQSKCPKFK
jgi:hypothetical protein